MGRPKKVDYAAMFSFDGNSGLYYCTRTIGLKKRKFRAKDPEALYAKIQAAEKAASAGPPIPTFREVAESWMNWKWPKIELKTQKSYEGSYNRAVAALGDELLPDIAPADIDQIIRRMTLQGYSAKTVKSQKSVLKMIFDYAITRPGACIKLNPVASVTIQRGLPRKKRSAPDDLTMQTIIDNVETATFGLFAYLLLYTGCRRGEALALTWGDIDFKAKKISVTKSYVFPSGMPVLKEPKTDAGTREIDLLPGLKAHLQRPETALDTTLIFPAPDGRPLQENAFRRRWRHYCKDAGFYTDTPEKRTSKQGKEYIYHNIKITLTPHQLRHGYATLCYESKVDPKAAQVMLGHADIQTTMQTYTDLREAHRQDQSSKLTDYMAQKYGEVYSDEKVDSQVDTKPASP